MAMRMATPPFLLTFGRVFIYNWKCIQLFLCYLVLCEFWGKGGWLCGSTTKKELAPELMR